jgi:hypothetical protein
MTYPSGSGVIVNNYGPGLPNTGASAEPVYAPSAVPSSTGTLAPPQSPSGDITGQSAASNFVSGETSTQTRLSEFGESEAQQGSNVTNSVCSFNSLAASAFQRFTFE